MRFSLHMTAGSLVTMVILSYLVAAAVLVVPGYLLGRRAPHATAVPGLVFMLLGSVLCAFASGAGPLTVGRVLGGLGAGAVAGAVFAVSGQVGPARVARLVIGILLGVSLVLGLVVGFLLTTYLSWRVSFLLAVPVAAVALIGAAASAVALLIMRTSRPNPPAAPTTPIPFPEQSPPGQPR